MLAYWMILELCSPNGDDFRQIDWVEEIEYPELTLQQTQDLLSIPI